MKQKAVVVNEFDIDNGIRRVNRYLKKGYIVYDVTRIYKGCSIFILSKKSREASVNE